MLSGELKLGEQLPTVRELATELRINFNTVARAYRTLDETRLISTQRGRGTYIWEGPTSEGVDSMRQKSLQALAENYLAGATQLGFSPEQIEAALKALLREGYEDDKVRTDDE